MTSTQTASPMTDRYNQLSEQHAYERRIAAQGLPALLEPYIVRLAGVSEDTAAV